ncbi:MAG: hypothetical protein WD877_01815, partial [Candidatus Saccharimonadales bacterium]
GRPGTLRPSQEVVTIKAKSYKLAQVAAFLVVMGLTGAITAIALASQVQNPVPSCPSGWTFNQSRGTCDKIDNTNVTATVVGARASASALATGKVTILADVLAKAGAKVKSPACFWTKGGFWNSGRGADGRLWSFWDPVPGKLCPAKGGYVKVAGGTTGRACFNPARVSRPLFPVVKGKVVMVRSFASVRIILNAVAKVSLTDTCGSASASGTAQAVIRLRAWIRAKSRSGVQASILGRAVASAKATASAQLTCVPPGTTTVTTTTTTTPAVNRPPTGQLALPKHLFTDRTHFICVDNVSDPDGNPVTVSFQVSAGTLSGNVYTQSGGARCQVYSSPSSPQEISVWATLRDDRGGETPLFGRFPVVRD